MPNILDDLATIDDSSIDGKAPPSTKFLDFLHLKVSVTRPEDIHHSLGTSASESSPGNHTHDGKNSKFLFDAAVTTLTDLPATPTSSQIQTAVNNINAALRLIGAG
jgi:hypothetical protein